MAGEWQTIALKDIAESINTGLDAITRAPIVPYATAIKCLRIQDVSNNKIFSNWGFTEVRPVDYEKYRLRRGEIIMARTCSTGINYLVRADMEAVFNNGLARIRLHRDSAFPEYVYYVFKSQNFINYIDGISGGTSVQLNMKVGDLAKFRFPLPPLAEQKAIAAVLGALDDKIELNRRMNATLEAMARALFQSWFVDFDPVRAKLDGRKPRGMDAATVELFPAGFWETPLGNVPDGWPVKPLSQIMIGKNARVGVLDVPEYSSTNDGLHPRTERFTKKLSASTAANKLIHEGDFVFGLSRQLLNFGLMKDNCGCVSPAYKVFTVDRNSIVPDLLELMMRQRPAYFFNAVSSSSREGQSISSDALGRLLVLQPARAVQDAFYELTKPYQQLRIAKELESETLATLRDTLLPKLLSGELSVADTTLTTGANL